MRALVLIVLLVSPLALRAQVVVPVHEEPRHPLVLDRGWLRVLDVQIQPGDTTLFHTHTSPIHYVVIGASRTNAQVLGRPWPAASSATAVRDPGQAFWTLEYASQPITHRVTNTGEGLFRLIGVTNEGLGIDDAATPGRLAGDTLPGAIEAESRWYRRARLILAPGDAADVRSAAGPVLAVQVVPGAVDVIPSEPAERQTIDTPGAWTFHEAGRRYTLRNAGSQPVTLVLVQILR